MCSGTEYALTKLRCYHTHGPDNCSFYFTLLFRPGPASLCVFLLLLNSEHDVNVTLNYSQHFCLWYLSEIHRLRVKSLSSRVCMGCTVLLDASQLTRYIFYSHFSPFTVIFFFMCNELAASKQKALLNTILTCTTFKQTLANQFTFVEKIIILWMRVAEF